MPTSISFFCPGLCQTAGSKRAFPLRKNGAFIRAMVVDANPKSKDWKVTVSHYAQEAMTAAGLPFEKPLLDGPLEVTFQFHTKRLGSHYRANGEVKPNAPMWPITRPDLLKLSRAIEDAMTGIVYQDDSQIVREHLEKVYSDKPGCQITITPIPTPEPVKAAPGLQLA